MDEAALDAWNLLGGLEWAGIPYAIAVLDVDDVEGLLHRMTAIREHLRGRND
jgi:hypothetical protein